MEELIETMADQWRITEGATEDAKKGKHSEIQLGAVFNGICYNCGKSGHRKTECRSAKKGGGNHNNNTKNGGGAGKGGFKGTCNHCKKPGHKEEDCWGKPGQEHK